MRILPMASSCGLRAYPGTLFVKILEQMSMVNFMVLLWAELQKALCLLMLLSRTISNLTFFSVNSTEEMKKKIRVTRPNSFIRVHACATSRGVWGRASILSVMPNAAPDTHLLYPQTRDSSSGSLCWSTARECLRCPS